MERGDAQLPRRTRPAIASGACRRGDPRSRRRVGRRGRTQARPRRAHHGFQCREVLRRPRQRVVEGGGLRRDRDRNSRRRNEQVARNARPALRSDDRRRDRSAKRRVRARGRRGRRPRRVRGGNLSARNRGGANSDHRGGAGRLIARREDRRSIIGSEKISSARSISRK